jgi:hypothetical protein
MKSRGVRSVGGCGNTKNELPMKVKTEDGETVVVEPGQKWTVYGEVLPGVIMARKQIMVSSVREEFFNYREMSNNSDGAMERDDFQQMLQTGEIELTGRVDPDKDGW